MTCRLHVSYDVCMSAMLAASLPMLLKLSEVKQKWISQFAIVYPHIGHMSPEPVYCIFKRLMEPRNRFRQASNRFLGSLIKFLLIRALEGPFPKLLNDVLYRNNLRIIRKVQLCTAQSISYSWNFDFASYSENMVVRVQCTVKTTKGIFFPAVFRKYPLLLTAQFVVEG
jgi:hypothetical protein